MTPTLDTLDHLVLTVADIDQTVAFYTGVLGMIAEQFTPADGSTRWALKFGSQKINLHLAGREWDPKAQTPVPGSADLCFLSSIALEVWIDWLKGQHVPVEMGPINRTGATGPIRSLYLRDPDGNLLEISNPL
ncbi:VOC family protein [Pseudoprimorskyibacter insulae]|uniref:Virulence protein n=1 Tax=Pseudoprimorskyibacter insulae TaxID=1695997 RepID=A0A2R8ATP6_9RHOB|nr:VOC family protein [Pseudoprimorskyibacter insulae]SPF79360.1 Virulence protein [Pseudoprimorskyibacter insulae]